MRYTSMLILTLGFTTAIAIAQPVSSDSQMTQPMLTEIRELRQDLLEYCRDHTKSADRDVSSPS